MVEGGKAGNAGSRRCSVGWANVGWDERKGRWADFVGGRSPTSSGLVGRERNGWHVGGLKGNRGWWRMLDDSVKSWKSLWIEQVRWG